MTFDRDRNATDIQVKSADEELDLALQAAAEAGDEASVVEDAGFGSFLERFPSAARDRRPPD